jgi:hypothetical protein
MMKLCLCLCVLASARLHESKHGPITDHSGYEVPFTKQHESVREQIWDKEASSILAKMKSTKPSADASIAALVATISEEKAGYYATMLSGENPKSAQYTRNSRSSADKSAIRDIGGSIGYVAGIMSDLGFDVKLHHYSSEYPPNVVASLKGTSNAEELVILGTHLDDRDEASNAVNRAPGANDDGSGSAALLATAEALAASGAKFERTLVLEWYTGEEQGLVGSRALAKKRNEDDDKVFAQIQQDMTGVVGAGDSLGLAFVQSGSAVSLEMTAYVEEVAAVYVDPALTLHHQVLSGSSCCSDHQSYAENGFLSVGLIEPRGYTGDPMYHRGGDLVERSDYSVKQLTLAGRVAMAAAATLAGFESMTIVNNATTTD